MRKDDINDICKDIDPWLSHGERMRERSDRALRLYHNSINDAGGEELLSQTLQQWAKANPQTIRPGRPLRDTQLGKIITEATHSGLDTIRNTGRIADITCIIISWSMNPAADPHATAVIGTSDQNVDQALSDLGWTEPQQIAATFQTHQRLQHHKQYLQKLTTIMNNIAGVLY
ncbi:hypothetical protein K439DRAFT_571832 [Ramaria rubella]|nr:hypothetical protein K439DRAFT_571832 [Ramaria rubella]